MSHNEQYMRKNIHQSVDWRTAVLATTQPHSVIKSNCYIITVDLQIVVINF